MNPKDIVASILQFITILTAWPIILLLLVLLFRRELKEHLPELFKRLRKASVGGNSFEFDAGLNAFQEAIDYGVKEFADTEKDQFAVFVKEQVKKLAETAAIDSPQSKRDVPLKPLRGLKILWVDDNPLNNVYEENYLKELGAFIIRALSTKEALEYLEKTNFDLIISDLGRVENGKRNPNAGYELLNSVEDLKIHAPFIFFTVRAPQLDAAQRKKVYGATNNGNELVSLIVQRVLKAFP